MDAAPPLVESSADNMGQDQAQPPTLAEVAQEALRSLLSRSQVAVVATCIEVSPHLHTATQGDDPDVRSRVRFSIKSVLRGSSGPTTIEGDIEGGTWQATRTTSSHGAEYKVGRDYLLMTRSAPTGQQLAPPNDNLGFAELTDFTITYNGQTFSRTAIPSLASPTGDLP